MIKEPHACPHTIKDFGPHEELVPGIFCRAEITESHDYDVIGRILE